MKSVLQDWVMELPLREQCVLLTGIRGCDETPKLPLDSSARRLTAYIRWCVLNPADPREVDVPGAFFQSMPPPDSWKASELGHLPQHWYSHVMHCFEVIGYRHPFRDVQSIAFDIYKKMAHSLHLNIESFHAMETRLSEDRIAAGTVVS